MNKMVAEFKIGRTYKTFQGTVWKCVFTTADDKAVLVKISGPEFCLKIGESCLIAPSDYWIELKEKKTLYFLIWKSKSTLKLTTCFFNSCQERIDFKKIRSDWVFYDEFERELELE